MRKIVQPVALLFLGALLPCFSSCGDGGGGRSSADPVEARKPKLQLAWDQSPGADGYRLHLERRNGNIRVIETGPALCWEGTDPNAIRAWVTAFGEGLESAPSNELELPCR